MAGRSVTEADGVIEGDDFEGWRVVRDHRAGTRTGRVAKRLGQLFRGARAPRGSRRATIVITDTMTGAIAIAVVTGTGQDIAVMVGSVFNMKDVSGNDDDCEASAHDADVKGRAVDERSEADGMRRRAVWMREGWREARVEGWPCRDADRSEGGEAHVAEWRRVGAKRVLGDVGRGVGSYAEVEGSKADGVSAALS